MLLMSQASNSGRKILSFNISQAPDKWQKFPLVYIFFWWPLEYFLKNHLPPFQLLFPYLKLVCDSITMLFCVTKTFPTFLKNLEIRYVILNIFFIPFFMGVLSSQFLNSVKDDQFQSYITYTVFFYFIHSLRTKTAKSSIMVKGFHLKTVYHIFYFIFQYRH